ncbi:MAG TPA: ATP-grasp domain-containing protein [Burkholderiales bacterium]|nr:ATP-grasp domain-containing protein [Burkholderiales bacterium]
MNAFLKVDRSELRHDRPPVMLLGGINLVRALGLARIPAIIASPEAYTPAMASRYCSGRCLLPPLAQREAVVERLMRAGELLSDAVGSRIPLFYGDDDYLGLIQDHVAELGKHYALLLNPVSLSRALHSKELFQALAESRGLPVPARLDFPVLDKFHGPVLVKPKMKTDWEGSAVYHQLFAHAGKARIFANGLEASQNELVRRMAGELQFQEYVPGDDRSLWSFHGFADEKSELVEWFVGRKIRTHPALTGDSTYLELAHDDELAALGRDLVRRIGLRGVFKMDFKRHADTGRFYLLEINARFNLWHYLGAANGVNLPQVAYEYLTRRVKRPHVPASTTYRWLSLKLDLRAYRREKLNTLEWLGSLLAAPKVYDLWSWSDPLPALADLRQYVPRARKKMMRWLSTAS